MINNIINLPQTVIQVYFFIIYIILGLFFIIYNRDNKEYTSPLEILFLIFINSFLVISIISIVLIFFKIWNFSLLLLIVTILTILLYFIGFLFLNIKNKLNEIHVHRKKKYLSTIIFITIITIASFFNFKPSEEISSRHDIGVYINTGVNIAKNSSTISKNPILANLSKEIKEELGLMNNSNIYPDFIVINEKQGIFQAIQPPLNQIWLAISYSLFGLKNIGLFTCIFSIISLCAIFLLTKHLYGSLCALITTFLLSTNYIQIFFAQYSSPEMLFQMLLFSGLLLLEKWKLKNKLIIITTALCFTFLLFTKIESLIILVAFVGYLILQVLSKYFPKKWKIFYISLFIGLIGFCIYSFIYLKTYIYLLQKSISIVYGNISMILLLVISFLLTTTIPLTLKRKKFDTKEKLNSFSGTVKIMLLVLFIVICLISSYFKIYRGDIDPIEALTYFISPIGFIFLLVGYIDSSKLKNSKESLIFSLLTLPFIFIFLYTIPNNTSFPWLMRRHISLVLPLSIIYIGYSICLIINKIKNIKLRLIVLLFILIPFSSYNLNLNKTLLINQFKGYVNQIDELSKNFTENDIILDANRFTDYSMATSLQIIYGKNAFFLKKDNYQGNIICEQIRQWNKENRRVYLVTVSEKRLKNFIEGSLIEFTLEKTINFNISKIEWEIIKSKINFFKNDWGKIKYNNKHVEIIEKIKIYQLSCR